MRTQIDTPGELSGNFFNPAHKLHSDALKAQFGELVPRVLHHDSIYRAVHLLDRAGISRTLAVTIFPRGGHPPEIAAIDSRIKVGGLIGETFRQLGFAIHRNTLDVDVISIPPSVSQAFRTDSQQATVEFVEFLVKYGARPAHKYGIIAEISHPDIEIPKCNSSGDTPRALTSDSIRRQGVSPDQIWNTLDRACFSTIDYRCIMAFQDSLRELHHTRGRVIRLLHSQEFGGEK